MAKIREDLVGVIHVPGGVTLKAGDTVPAGVVVPESRLTAGRKIGTVSVNVVPSEAAEEDAPVPEKPAPKRRTRKKAVIEDAGDVD